MIVDLFLNIIEKILEEDFFLIMCILLKKNILESINV